MGTRDPDLSSELTNGIGLWLNGKDHVVSTYRQDLETRCFPRFGRPELASRAREVSQKPFLIIPPNRIARTSLDVRPNPTFNTTATYASHSHSHLLRAQVV